MTLWGKLDVHFWIDAHADQFHDVFSCRPHHISNMSPHKIQGCDLDEDGSAKVAKDLVETIDDVNLLTVFKVIEVDLLKEYKSYKLTLQATPKGEGSVVRLTLEYEKIYENIRYPYSLLEFIVQFSKDVSHLVKYQKK
uniref:Bet v I/Major latex protein domain-containing protein n=1 Tax=Manihot esculenta TaxID=3983 RepID=A0A199UB65_MANES